jgi:hypothetical protein
MTELIAQESTIVAERPLEDDARRMLEALDALALARADASANAERFAFRVRFALARREELLAAAAIEGGAFAPARAEVALSILEGHLQTAAAFINRTLRDAARRPGRAGVRRAVEEAVIAVEQRQQIVA